VKRLGLDNEGVAELIAVVDVFNGIAHSITDSIISEGIAAESRSHATRENYVVGAAFSRE
jgi:hypothetical protein